MIVLLATAMMISMLIATAFALHQESGNTTEIAGTKKSRRHTLG
jgi:hypothetical protein